jgi:hypothetical protein
MAKSRRAMTSDLLYYYEYGSASEMLLKKKLGGNVSDRYVLFSM